ncbi:unnamed protein product [Paramecium sonneborni]|uniref:Protein kinase domain-containing protein n=1 Tax=Paramecium sonneborni TaxID=65129 RepID=A0A8S1KGR1_9CILI|nr:unnamed protein product [Paramecium sonneborni]
MGQTNSQNLQQSKVDVPKINQLQFWKQSTDIRYGEIRIFKTQDQHAVAVKDHIFQDDGQWNQFKIVQEKQMGNKQSTPFLIQMIDLQHVTEKELCTQLTQAHSVYEYFDEYLERVINELSETKQYFEEIEIVAMLHCTLMALQRLNDQQKQHGDIRPLTISVTSYAKRSQFRQNHPFSVFKLTDIQEMTDMNAYRRCIAKQQGQYNLSPEQLSSLKQKVLKLNIDQNKSDVFCIGLTALQMATLSFVQDIYDLQSYTLNMEKFNDHLFLLKSQYSSNLYEIVESLLVMAPDNRPNPKQAHDLLHNYGFQLEDYFRSSTIAEFIPSYSIDFKEQNNGYVKQKQRVVDQQLHSLQNQDPNNLYNQVENIEQRAKLALKRSQDAQIRFQKSPQKKFKIPIPNWEPTKSLQQYSNLSPITLEEILPLQNKQMNIQSDQIIIQDPPSNRQSFFKNLTNPQQYQQHHYNEHEQIMHNDDEYAYNHQEIDEQPKQSLVEQVELTNSNLKTLQQKPITNQYDNNLFQQQSLFQSINTDQKKYPQQQYQQQQQQEQQQQQQQFQQQQQQTYSQIQQQSYQYSNQIQSKQLQNIEQQSQARSSTYNYPQNQLNESVNDHQRSPYALQQRQSLALSQDKVITQQLTGQQVEQTLQNLQNRQSIRQDSFGVGSQRPQQPLVVPKSPEIEPKNIFIQFEQEKLTQQNQRSPIQPLERIDDDEQEPNYNPHLTESNDSQQAISIQSKPQSMRGTMVGSQTHLKVPSSVTSKQQRPTVQKQQTTSQKNIYNLSQKKSSKIIKK